METYGKLLIKLDMLSVEAIDKIQLCIELLQEYGYINKNLSLREAYEQTIGIYNIEREDPNMWEMVWEHKILSLFQMTQQSGINAINLAHPSSVDDLAHLNSVIRLMAQEKGGEIPLNKFARFKNDITLWYDEMHEWGLNDLEIELIKPIAINSYGITESQESFMQLVQIPECGGFDLNWADRLRKSIAKKNPKEFDKLTDEYFKNCEEKKLSKPLCNYVWKVLVGYSRGYGFNLSHCLAYSLIALQEMNLAYKYPIIFWNCACLITDSGGMEKEEEDEGVAEVTEEVYSDSIEDFIEEEEEDDNEEDEVEKVIKKKKKTTTVNYGKIATAIGKMKAAGINVEPPDINKSSYTFSPDAELNLIRYGISGITRIGEDIVKDIMANRPYTSLDDFISKVKVNKVQIINLIKSGAFDSFGKREDIMESYINKISGAKQKLNLQNMQTLINYDLLPYELDFVKKVFNFNKYLKKNKLDTIYYAIDNVSFKFYSDNFDIDILEPAATESGFKLNMKKWDNIYQSYMNKARDYIKKNQQELLTALNNKLTEEVRTKYCEGNISKWEMDSVSFYSHEHELSSVDLELYGISNFFDLDETPRIEHVIPIKGKMIPIFKLERIAGTVLDRDKAKKTVTLLTTEGVVTVKIYGNVFMIYDRQISEKGADGKKHVIEKSVFSRGNKIIVTGIRQEDSFVAKTYARTQWHKVEQIVKINDNGHMIIKAEREE